MQRDGIAATVNLLAQPHCADSLSLFHCLGESKRGRILRMKHWKTALAILAVLSASIALADDVRRIWR
jgi:hypothetical protein